MFSALNWQQMTSAFIVLFAVIDIIGSIPIIINLKEKGKDVNALKATLISFALLIGFFYAGDMMLKLFHVDIESFAVAGAFVIFLMSLEMILDIEIFKNQGPIKEATLVPLVFPLLAGAGAFTTLLSLRAEYASINIIIALLLTEPLLPEKRYTGTVVQSMGLLVKFTRHAYFMLILIMFSLLAAPYMAYVSVSSFVYMNTFHLSPQLYGLYFSFNSTCAVVGPFLYLHIAGRVSNRRITNACFLVTAISGVALLTIG